MAFFAVGQVVPGQLLWHCSRRDVLSPARSFLRRMFVVQQIASSNLLLLVMDAACDCSVFPPVPLDAKEVKYILPRAAGTHGSAGLFARVENLLPKQLPQGWRAWPDLWDSQGERARRRAGRVEVW